MSKVTENERAAYSNDVNALIQAILTGVTAFVATNIDDLLLLTLFFAQSTAGFRTRHIVLGQYLGFSALILASLPGFFGGLILPRPWIGLLGILPIAIGIHSLIQQDADDIQIQTVSPLKEAESDRSFRSVFKNLFAPQTYTVMAVTCANGGDNIGIYVPLFASSNWQHLITVLSTFYILIGVWCYIAYRLARQPAVASVLARYGQRIVPFVLMGLGLLILVESQSYRLLPFFA